MKKAAIIIGFISAFIFKLEGQFSIGVTGGVNLATARFVDSQLPDPEMTVYYFAGIVPGYAINEKISFLTDIQYSQKGYKHDGQVLASYSQYRFSYIDLLPQLEYRVLDNIGLGAGVNVGFKLAEDFKSENSDWVSNDQFEFIKSMDFGIVASIKYYINNFNLLARINYGLNDISDLSFTDINGQTIENVNMKNTTIQLGIGYTFEFATE